MRLRFKLLETEKRFEKIQNQQMFVPFKQVPFKNAKNRDNELEKCMLKKFNE